MARSMPGSGSECCCKNNVKYEKCYVDVKVYFEMSVSVSMSDCIRLFQLPVLQGHLCLPKTHYGRTLCYLCRFCLLIDC